MSVNAIGTTQKITNPLKIENKTITEPLKETQEKKQLSNGTKTLIGLGVLAGTIATGLLVKKRLDVNSMKKFVQNFEKNHLKKSDEINVDDLFIHAKELANKYGEGATICLLNKKMIQEMAETNLWVNKIMKNAQLSDNVHMIIAKRPDGKILQNDIKFFDGKTISQDIKDLMGSNNVVSLR